MLDDPRQKVSPLSYIGLNRGKKMSVLYSRNKEVELERSGAS